MNPIELRNIVREEISNYKTLLDQNEAFADNLQEKIAKLTADTPDEVLDRIFKIVEEVRASIETIKYRIKLGEAVLKLVPLPKANIAA